MKKDEWRNKIYGDCVGWGVPVGSGVAPGRGDTKDFAFCVKKLCQNSLEMSPD
jgi:hypothetical protein